MNLGKMSTVLDSRIEELAQQVLTDPSARALVKIAKGSSAVALSRLVLELENERWEIRWLAVHVLGELDSEEAAAATRSMVSDENEHVRHAQIAARARRDKGGEDRVMEDVESPSAPTEQEVTATAPLENEPEPDTITPFDTDAEIQSVVKSMESLRAVRSQLIIV